MSLSAEDRILILDSNYGFPAIQKFKITDSLVMKDFEKPRKQGYEFAGWWNKRDFDLVQNELDKDKLEEIKKSKRKRNLTYVAKWTPVGGSTEGKYTVSFWENKEDREEKDKENGEDNDNEEDNEEEKKKKNPYYKVNNIPYGGILLNRIPPTNPTKPNYAFVKWVDCDNPSKELDAYERIFFDRDFYAVFEQIEYKLEFITESSYEQITVKSGEEIGKDRLPAIFPIKNGYTSKWVDQDDEDCEIKENTIPTKNMTIIPKYTENEYSLSFDALYIGEKMEYEIQFTINTEIESEEIQKIVPTIKSDYKDTYVFSKWSIDKIEKGTYGNLTARAIYSLLPEKTEYEMSFNLDGGELEDGSMVMDSVKIHTGDEIKGLPFPTKFGCVFKYWEYLDKKVENGDKYIWEEDVKLTAIYRPLRYTLTYDGNGATDGHMDSPIVLERRQSYILDKNQYTRESDITFDWNDESNIKQEMKYQMEFAGWSKSKKDSIPQYYDEQTVANLGDNDGDEITLYAMWRSQKMQLPVPDEREGYVFLGWSLEKQADFPQDGIDTKAKVKSIRVGFIKGNPSTDPIANNENYMYFAPANFLYPYQDSQSGPLIYDKENHITLYAMWYNLNNKEESSSSSSSSFSFYSGLII